MVCAQSLLDSSEGHSAAPPFYSSVSTEPQSSAVLALNQSKLAGSEKALAGRPLASLKGERWEAVMKEKNNSKAPQTAANTVHVIGGQLIDNTPWFRKHNQKS